MSWSLQKKKRTFFVLITLFEGKFFYIYVNKFPSHKLSNAKNALFFLSGLNDITVLYIWNYLPQVNDNKRFYQFSSSKIKFNIKEFFINKYN